MNKLTGRIVNVASDNHMSILEMDVDGELLKAIVIETPETAPFLRKGNGINIMFKETEVSIAKDFSGVISLQNKMNCTVKEIKKGTLLSRVLLDFKGNEICSVITSAAVEQLGLSTANKITALIKTNEVMIAPND
ncbi:MAG TPA: TOBE domain-containing protein [Bacteroidales bacterium]|nr:TOBE domain-containing protein [Bacteroidales bacterium]